MFTGLVEEMGTVMSLEQAQGGWHLSIAAERVLEGTQLGDSIAINGTCLTVTALTGRGFMVGLAPETLHRTNLGDLRPGALVNLERSLPANGRVGGHFVQGHVDGTGVIQAFRPDGDSLWVTVCATPDLLRYIVPKGFIAIDGTSLTVVDVREESFTFMLIAYTQNHINLPHKKVGERVNIEVDMVGKYVEKFVLAQSFAGVIPHVMGAN